MAHPKRIKIISGKKYHLEDTVKTKCSAESLRKHLSRTEDKSARKIKTKKGWEVYWRGR